MGELRISGTTFESNHVPEGDDGAIGAGGIVVIDNSHFRDNQAQSGGGAINSSAHLTITNSLFERNQGGMGGAIYSSAHLFISGSTFSNNGSVELGNMGGALGIDSSPSGPVIIESSNFLSNTGVLGGAIYSSRATLNIRGQSMIAGNSAKTAVRSMPNIAR